MTFQVKKDVNGKKIIFVKYGRRCIVNILLIYFFYLHSVTAFTQVLNLSWTPSTSRHLSHYSIYRTSHVESSFVLISTKYSLDSTFVDAEVHFGLTYYYVATAADLLGNESRFSNIIDTTLIYPDPVELINFSVKLQDNNAILEWMTATESNNYGFEIQKSINGISFKKVGFVNGNCTTFVQNHYKFVDNQLAIGTHYYRLKQIDFNGDYEFTNILKITIGAPNEFHLGQNYPNPFNPSTSISYSLPKSSRVELFIYNVSGQIIYKLVNEFQKADRYTVTWNGIDATGKNVVSGVYYYKIHALNSAMFRKMILVR